MEEGEPSADHDHSHGHGHDNFHGHDHIHGVVDPTILTTERGIWAVKWSFAGLFVTALLQVVVVVLSGSVALMADTIHNIGDAATAIPLWVAFRLQQRKPSRMYTYGLGRVEDLAGVAIVLTILASALIAGYEAVDRLLHPREIAYLGAVVVASVVGFIGNELVAVFRIRVGKEIGSAALVADGHHARVDGLTSLAVLFGAIGVWMGYPMADPLIGLLITAAILRIVWDSGKTVLRRMLDGIDPEVLDELERVACRTKGVSDVTEVRVRWLGHRLLAEINVTVDPELSVSDGHAIATEVRHQLLHQLRYFSDATIHVDPATASGEAHHCVDEHEHDGLPPHPH